ncbi:MAG: 30S ribosomal protein S20 [Clostridiales bacterium]|nr:30S ribosomal protein S20 [Clostridiales bacterium]
MPNTKSAKKRVKITARQNLRNKKIKSRVKTEIKKVILAVKEKNLELAENNLKIAQKYIDISYSKGVYHKNNAARKKIRIAKLFNKLKSIQS